MEVVNKFKNIRDLNNISPPQRELFNILIKIFPDAELEYKIGGRVKKKGYHVRWADIGIPSLKLAFEYDGWCHNFGEYTSFEDEKRDKELSLQGWKIFRINKEILKIIKSNKTSNQKEFLILLDRVVKLVSKYPLTEKRIGLYGGNPTNLTNYT